VALGHQHVAVTVESSDIAHVLKSRAFRFFEVLRDMGVRSCAISVDDPASLQQSLNQALESGVTAVMAGDDSSAVSVMELLADWGYDVPNEISVTGFDSVGVYGSSLLGLASVKQPVDALADASLA